MVLSNEILQQINERKHDINDFLLNPFIPRIKAWITKSDETNDAFDKYLALFISANMFYNLWAKIKNPNIDYEDLGDRKKFMETIELIDFQSIPFSKGDINELIEILIEESLIVEIKKKENRRWVTDGLAQEKLQENIDNNEQLTKYLWETLYKIRCNLVHGEKGYEQRQVRLLNKCSSLLKNILTNLILRLENLVNHQRGED
jgi:hypothetical protein